MELSGFHVSIHSDGEVLKEHSIEISPDGKKATCWVPSQSGKEFMVKYRIGKSSDIKHKAKSVHLFMDGHRMKKCLSLPDEGNGAIKGVQTSNNKMRPFVFADIRMTDEDTVSGDTRMNPNDMGTIRVLVFLAESWRRHDDDSSRRYRIQDHPPATVDERAKKALEHCVSLGDEQPYKPSARYSSVYDSEKPDLVFEFRYRPPPMLQALGIISPPKREEPLVIDLDDEDAPPPPKRRKATHKDGPVQSMQTELDRLRRRVGELEGKRAGPSGVKKEAIKHDPDDVIDLT